jgi:PhnB protein
VQDPDGAIGHAEVRIGDAVVMMFVGPADWPDTPAFLRLYVPDGDAVFSSALAAGATAVTAMTELFWGDRVGRVRDPFGNLWWIQTRVAEVDAQEAERRGRAAGVHAAMEYVASGEFVRST